MRRKVKVKSEFSAFTRRPLRVADNNGANEDFGGDADVAVALSSHAAVYAGYARAQRA